MTCFRLFLTQAECLQLDQLIAVDLADGRLVDRPGHPHDLPRSQESRRSSHCPSGSNHTAHEHGTCCFRGRSDGKPGRNHPFRRNAIRSAGRCSSPSRSTFTSEWANWRAVCHQLFVDDQLGIRLPACAYVIALGGIDTLDLAHIHLSTASFFHINICCRIQDPAAFTVSFTVMFFRIDVHLHVSRYETYGCRHAATSHIRHYGCRSRR